MGDVSPTAENAPPPVFEYTAQAVSPLVNGEVKLKIGDNGLTAAALFDAVEIPFADMCGLSLVDYVVTIKTDGGDYVFSRMGSWCQPFHDALYDAYNRAVLRSLFIKDDPLLFAKGDYQYTEGGAVSGGAAPVHVYDSGVVTLPPDLNARRVPLCFVTGLEKGEFSLTLTLDTGERYTYAKLGYETAPFADKVEQHIRALREATLAAVNELDPLIPAAQANHIVKLMPRGAAASFGQIAAVAPAFPAALEAKLADTRAAESYAAFKTLCDPMKIRVGFKKNEVQKKDDPNGASNGPNDPQNSGQSAAAPAASVTGGAPVIMDGKPPAVTDGASDTAPPPDPWLLWLIAPSPDGRFAAVEFAEADTATFVYDTDDDFDGFAQQMNRALEAIDFKREVIRLTDEELLKPENADYRMAAKRNAALRFIRSHFVGRVIHTGADVWKSKLTALWRGGAPGEAAAANTPQSTAKFCGQCGGPLAAGAQFCGVCGAKR